LQDHHVLIGRCAIDRDSRNEWLSIE